MRIRKHHVIGTLAAIALAVLLALEALSIGAAAIFNQVAAQQGMLRGSVHVEKLFAHINGHVRFEGLVWEDEAGNPVLVVPEGSFYVKPLDVLTGRLSSRSLTRVELTDAAISLRIRRDAQERPEIDFVTPSEAFFALMEREPPRKKRKGPPLSPEERAAKAAQARAAREQQLANSIANFNREGRRLDLDLVLKHCKVEVLYEKRHYLLGGAQLTASLHTEGVTRLDFSSGGFGGTMVGRGVSMKGTIDARPSPVPEVRLSVLASEVDPSSLGFGMDIHDKMTLTANFTGPITHPVGSGTVSLPVLSLPGLAFTNVTGRVTYQGSRLDFTDVTANVYGGTFAARGTYDLDARTYHLEGHGEDLSAAKALPGKHLKCLVALDIAIDSAGSARETVTSGSFVSGPGRYHLIVFDRLSGRFTDRYHDLQFYDADIEMAGGHIKTETFRIKDRKLTLAPVEVYDAEGRLLMTYAQGD